MRIITEAGYSKPTPLQKKLIPLILKGKDVAVETGDQTGKTAAFLLPLMQKIKKSKRGTKILILAPSLENSRKIYKFFRIFYNKKLTKLNAVLLGEESETKREFKLLLKEPDVIIGTSKKIIDHIRRDNLTFNHLEVIVMDAPEESEYYAFAQDAHFIFTKMPRRVHKIFFSPTPISGPAISDVIRRPIILNKVDWLKNLKAPEHFYYETEDGGEKILHRFILGHKLKGAYVFGPSPKQLPFIKKELTRKGIRAEIFSPHAKEEVRSNLLSRFSSGEWDVLLCHKGIDLRQLGIIKNVVLLGDPESIKEIITQIITKSQDEVKIFSIIETSVEFNTNELQENGKLSSFKTDLPSDTEVLEGLIVNMVNKIKEDSDIEELIRLKKIIKKNVPFLQRANFMAYLLKERIGGKSPNRAPANKAGVTRLFVNIGKNRKIFPKDIISLFSSKLKIDPKEITGVNVLDNYSFLELKASLASRAIEELGGEEFKGKKIAVNYARKKETRRRPQPYRRRKPGN